MKLLSLLLLVLLSACGEDISLDDLADSDSPDNILRRVIQEEPPVAEDPTAPETTGSEAPTSNFITGRIYMPDQASGFKCQSAETRGGQTVCLLPHQYTLPPYYTKTDHHGSRFSCNVNGDTFQRFVLDAAGTEYPMFIEKNNPYGAQSGPSDYFCANYVGTGSGNIGRTHIRLTKQWRDFDGQSVSIKVCDANLCDTLILR